MADEVDRAQLAAEIEGLRAEVERLRTDLMESDEIREKLGHLLTRTAAALKGEPPEGVWHSWHDLPEKATQLAEALRELEGREQRDEVLLRQALEALEVSTRFVYADMRPQCEDTIAALRERLSEKE
jgi:septal ring factor EnvC (AmiA/AmiB activator)